MIPRTLTAPLHPRVETWVRRVMGIGLGVLAVLAGIRMVQLTAFLSRARGSAATPSVDPHGFGAATLMYLLVPATVLLGFGSVSVWRKWSVPPALPLATIVALELIVRGMI